MPPQPPSPLDAIRLCPVPNLLPPYDDEITPASQRGAAVSGLRSEQRGTSARATREDIASKEIGRAHV